MHSLKSHRIIAVLALFAVAVVVSVYAQNAFSTMGVSEQEAKRSSLDGLVHNYLPFSLGAKTFKASAPAVRAQLVQGALTWFKAYTETAMFKSEYAKLRESAKPETPKATGTVDSELAKQKAERDKGLAEMKANLAKMPPDMRKQMEATIKQMETMYAQQDKDPQMKSMMRQGVEAQRADEDTSYKHRVADFEKKYPADPKVLIAHRLQEFLELSKDVDFSAQLKPVGSKMRFVNPAYESKSGNWKLCYRAGKPAVDAARVFATAWLKQLPVK